MYEEVPINLFYITQQSKHKKAAKRFLAFIAKPDNLFRLNKASGYLSPNVQSKKNNDPLLQKTLLHIESSAGFSYFFNRNSPPEMSRSGTKLLGEFITNPDIDYYIDEFEKLRSSIIESHKK